jgi:hypothetical protein
MIYFYSFGDLDPELRKRLNEHLSDIVAGCIELLSHDDSKTEQLSWYFFDRIVYENPERCRTVLHELEEWLNDGWMHYLGSLHEYALCRILENECRCWDDEHGEEGELEYSCIESEMTDSSDIFFERNIGNPHLYMEECFEDDDFFRIENVFRGLYEEGVLNKYDLSDDDLYFLPRDIREEYVKNRKYYEFDMLADNVVDFLKRSLTVDGVEKLLWNDDGSERKEIVSHILVDAILYPFCAVNNLDITREAVSGLGAVDFKISRGDKSILLEFKRFTGSLKPVTDAARYQLPGYLRSRNVGFGILVVLCFCDPSKELTALQQEMKSRFKEYKVDLELIELKRQRTPPSKLRE